MSLSVRTARAVEVERRKRKRQNQKKLRTRNQNKARSRHQKKLRSRHQRKGRSKHQKKVRSRHPKKFRSKHQRKGRSKHQKKVRSRQKRKVRSRQQKKSRSRHQRKVRSRHQRKFKKTRKVTNCKWKVKKGNEGIKMNNRGKKNSKVRTERETMKDCIKPALKYMEQMSHIVSNFERQSRRAVKHSDLMHKKNQKTEKFKSVAAVLLIAGGGKRSNMSCGGQTGNTGAATLTKLTASLAACPQTVNASCGNHTWLPLDPALVSLCSTLVQQFKAEVESCLGPSLMSSCSCWDSASLSSRSARLSDCAEIKTPQQTISEQKVRCTEAFRRCKAAEDDSVRALAVCIKSEAQLIDMVGFS